MNTIIGIERTPPFVDPAANHQQIVLATLISITIAHVGAIAIAIALIAVARPPCLSPLPSLLPLSPLPSQFLPPLLLLPLSSLLLLLTTVISIAITLAALAIALFLNIALVAIAIAFFVAVAVACHPCRHHHRLAALALFVARQPH
jgi:hypothetical protein